MVRRVHFCGPSSQSSQLKKGLSGFLHCNQCMKVLHLIYQSALSNDFHLSLLSKTYRDSKTETVFETVEQK